MLVNILVILFFLILISQIFLANNFIEGYMAVIGPVITPVNKMVDKPKNTYYQNNKITQDFDPDGVIQDYIPNSNIIQEDPDYILTENS
jgi:hypothetical protein